MFSNSKTVERRLFKPDRNRNPNKNKNNRNRVDATAERRLDNSSFSDLHFGSLVNDSSFYSHKSTNQVVCENKKDIFKVSIDYNKSNLDVYLCLENIKPYWYKLHISFSSVNRIIVDSDNNRILLDLLHVPILYRLNYKNVNLQKIKKNFKISAIFWASLKEGHDAKRCENFDSSLQDQTFALCRSYLFEFGDDGQKFRFYLSSLLHLNHVSDDKNKSLVLNYNRIDIYTSKLSFEKAIAQIESAKFPFSVHYALLALFTGSYKALDSLAIKNQFDEFLKFILEQDLNHMLIVRNLEDSIFALKNLFRENYIDDAVNQFQTIFSKMPIDEDNQDEDEDDEEEEEEEEEEEGERERERRVEVKVGEDLPTRDKGNYVLVRRANLSVSHLEFCQAIPLLKSRFTSLSDVDYSIRIQVQEDNNQRLTSMLLDKDNVKNILIRKLLTGITIQGRRYEFLGSSSSQMKDHGIIYYAKDNKDMDAEKIRQSVGDLTRFKHSVPKFAARLGLIFSQSIGAVEVPKELINIMEDKQGSIKPDYGTFINLKKDCYCFSDGVGYVSQDIVLERFLACLHLKKDDYLPSAYQIRYGGCKGMLAWYPIDKSQINIRESMRKFISDDNTLRILKYSCPRYVCLNRQLLHILDQAHVGRDVFYDFFQDNTSQAANASLDDQSALELIQKYSPSFIPYKRFLNAKVKLLCEPFFRSIVHYLINYRLKELKTKGRIYIPYENGRTAFGLVDEFDELEYGQVFFQYSVMDEEGKPTQETRFLEGEVMITKFPCLHPGDVRKFYAYRPSKGCFDHIKDCIIFPSKGNRPHPDEMGGSDLDGDEYAIFWETPLIFPSINCEPMTFPYGMNLTQEKEITVDDVVQFYVDYFLNNNIGLVATSHLIFSDLHPRGMRSQECVKLAEQYSISLDFQKTGYYEQKAVMYKYLIRPDFMNDRPSQCAYLSRRILGQFYRHCSLIEQALNLPDFECTRNFDGNKMGDRHRYVLPGWHKYRTQAQEAFNDYAIRIREILDQFKIDSEIELLCDVYENKAEASKVIMDRLFHDFRVKFARQCRRLGIPKRRFKKKKKKDPSSTEVTDEATTSSEINSNDDREKEEDEDLEAYYAKDHERNYLISAWYAIVLENASHINGQPLYGLPWLLHNEMIFLSQYVRYQTIYEERDRISSSCEIKLSGSDHFSLISNSFHYQTMRCLANSWFSILQKKFYGKKFKICMNAKSINENDLWLETIQKFIDINIRESLKKLSTNQTIYKFESLSKTFNAFMHFLFGICNNSNRHINNSNLENVLLLKYVIFAHKFMSKFEDEIDERFGQVLESTNEYDRDLNNQNSLIFQFLKEMKAKFTNYFNPERVGNVKSQRHLLLEPEGDLPFLNSLKKEKGTSMLAKKLEYLTGVEKISLSLNSNPKTLKIMLAEDEKPDDVLSIRKNKVYLVDCEGFSHSICILHLLLGHTKVFINILNRFEIIEN